MFKWLVRSGVIMGMLIMAAGTVMAVFNWSEVDNMFQRGGNKVVGALQIEDENEIEESTRDSQGKGKGFYMAIYEDVSKNPNRLTEEKIKERFGIDFKVVLDAPTQEGKFLFQNHFKSWSARNDKATAPQLSDTLQSDCVRVKAAQVDDERRRWDILKSRLAELQESDDEQTDGEVITRLAGAIDEDMNNEIDQAILNIPNLSVLDNQDVLLKCYDELSSAVDFELRLQSILNPSRKQLEAMQVFMNGRLDDFAGNVPLTDVSYADVYLGTFPKYDLMFDIDVIDMIFFGSSVGTEGIASSGRPDEKSKSPAINNYNDILAATTPTPAGDEVTASGSTGPSSSSSDSTVAGPQGSQSNAGTSSTTAGFGTSSRQFAGPICTEGNTGLDLDYSTLSGEGSEGTLESLLPDGEIPIRSISNTPPIVISPPNNSEELLSDSANEILNEEGKYEEKNRKAVCEGTAGVNFGNDFLSFLFCIDIKFSKIGKTWKSTGDDNCIACHIYALNRVFEDKVFKSSIRPHKNTGTIMESGLCEEAYGDNVGFFSFIEWVPVKFYPEICYPQGGVTSSEYAELIGYPEIVSKVDQPGFELNCEIDFRGEEAVKNCREALGGKNVLTYEEFKASYLTSVDQGLKSLENLNRNGNVWARLVGDQGIVEREAHVFLYKLGKDLPRFDEEKNNRVPQRYKIRMEYLANKMEEIRRDEALSQEQKVGQYLCLKGYSVAEDCEKYEYTFRAVEEELAVERDRIAGLTRTWNTVSRDFNQENSCGTFAGSGPIDLNSIWDDIKGRAGSGYYLETGVKKIQTPSEQVTAEIFANTEIEDLNQLFSEINQQVEFIDREKSEEQLKRDFELEQDKSLLYSALMPELVSFRSILASYTDWWVNMINDKQFVSKAGERIGFLESLMEKLR